MGPVHDIMTMALLGEDLGMFSTALGCGANPFIPINGSLSSTRLRGSLTRLCRIPLAPYWALAAERVKNLRRMMEHVLYYEKKYTAQWILYRFLCRWCRWRRREVPVREAVWSQKIWSTKTGKDFLGPGKLLYLMLLPSNPIKGM
jgi:hypothetical protein